jgi:lysozyme
LVPTIEDALTPGIFLEPASRDTLPAGASLRPVFEKGLAVTKVSEGWRSELYNDVAGYCTIGYGHLVKRAPCDGSEPPQFKRGLSEPEGSDLLRSDMAGAQRTVITAVTTELTDAQYAALCDFVYNVGSTNFRNSTLLRVVNAREFHDVPAQFMRWIMAGGKEVPGLVNRRERQIKLFFDGAPIPRAAPAPSEDSSPLDIRTGR